MQDDYIQQTFAETAQHYNELKAHHAARLLLLPKGSPQVRKINNGKYIYLRRYAGPNKRKELYYGPYSTKGFISISKFVENRKASKKALSSIKSALKKLWIPKKDVNRMDFLPLIKDLLHTFSEEDVWDAGIVLVGAWCFNIYRNVLDMPGNPLRTHDIDFAVTLPLKSRLKNIPQILKQLGFEESIDYSSEKSIFSAGGLSIEFISHRTASSRKLKKTIQQQLGITPEALPYVDVLTDNAEEFHIHGVGRVFLPSVESFILHKLLILPDRNLEAKRLKDVSQILSLVDFVLRNVQRTMRLRSIFDGFNASWQKRIKKVVGNLPESIDHQRQEEIAEQFSKLIGRHDIKPL